MRLYIPAVGDELELISDWEFQLYNERRNETLMNVLGDNRPTASYVVSTDSIPATIPQGAILKVDRIYIRKGLDDFSSLTFLWKGEATDPMASRYTWRRDNDKKKRRRPVRFWAKLEDVNNIEFRIP